MHLKDFRARVKATGEHDDLDEGQYRALVSVFGNEDSVGDVVMPGAFSKTLKDWQDRGDPIPLIWSHDWSDPYSHIGHVVAAEETDDGLVVTGQLDLDNPKAEQVYRLLKGRRVTQHSFAYDIEDSGFGERGDREVYELRELKLHEVGPCLVGANQETELLAAKAQRLAGDMRRGAKTDVESLRVAYDTLGTLLHDADNETGQHDPEPDEDSDNEEETGQGDDETATDDDPAGKSAASPHATPAQVLASLTLKRITGGRDADAV